MTHCDPRRAIYNDRLTPVAETDNDGRVVSIFVYGSMYVKPDIIISNSYDGTWHQYRIIGDQIGSPRLIIESSTGLIVHRIDYDEYGNSIATTGLFPLSFASGVFDSESQLTLHGMRSYLSSVGRWISKDPLKLIASERNSYSYALNDPINQYDINGLWTVGIGRSYSAGAFVQGSGDAFLVIDDNGNVGVSAGLAGGGMLGGGLGLFDAFQITDADTIYNLSGTSTQAGGSISIAEIAGLGFERIESSTYKGYNIGYTAGIGTPWEAHYSWSYSVVAGVHFDILRRLFVWLGLSSSCPGSGPQGWNVST